MGIVLHLASLLACLQIVHLYPLQDDRGSLFENYGMRLAKRPLYPYSLSPFGLLEHPKVSQGQRKKAVDSTFIRFGRSSASDQQKSSRNERSLDDYPGQVLLEDSQEMPPQDLPEFHLGAPQRFILDHNGCRVRDSKELMRALLSDPMCIRAFQKAKKENVNDTFIRFGKREAPPEKEFEDSNEGR